MLPSPAVSTALHSTSVCPTCGLEVDPALSACPRDGTWLGPSSEREAPLEPTLIRSVPTTGERSQLFPRVTPQPPMPVDQELASDALTARWDRSKEGNSPQPVAPDSLIGRGLGEYQVLSRVGEGGMGIVFEAIHPMIGKHVAIKILRPEYAGDPEQVERLLEEARAVNAIHHRGIIDIYGFGQLPDGQHYMVMEFLDGFALDKLIRDRAPLSPAEVLQILSEVFSALDAAHGAGVIHRDLKPSNIFLVKQPDGSRYVKILDFGLATRSAPPRGSPPVPRLDQVVGTPEYMSPEQARGKEVTPQTDLYAMLTGWPPFSSGSPIETLVAQLERPPPAPSSREESIPAELDSLVLKLLSKAPAQRPPSAEAVRLTVKRLLKTLATQATQSSEAPTGR